MEEAAAPEVMSGLMQTSMVCYAPTMITTNGIWHGDDPLKFSLPLFILQLTLVVITTRALVFLLRPLRQPRVVAEILGGVLLGPSGVGRTTWGKNLFPSWSVLVLQTMANVGLLYFLFLVGVETDLAVIRRSGRKSAVIAVVGMVVPFLIGAAAATLVRPVVAAAANAAGIHHSTFALFLGISVSVTAFPVLARILVELKLLNTSLGRLALSAAIVNDICAWVLLALAIAVADNRGSVLSTFLVVASAAAFIASAAAFIAFALVLLRPAVHWLLRRTPEGEAVSDLHVCLLLTGVMVCGFVTDAIGVHSIFGAFVFGLIIPHGGPVGAALVDKLEDFVSGLLLPLFFAISGLRTDVHKIAAMEIGWAFLSGIIVLASAGKVGSTALLGLFYRLPIRESVSLGVLMNTKGLIEMIVLNIGRDQKVLDASAFALMVVMAVVMTCMVSPVVTMVYRPLLRQAGAPYNLRTVHRAMADGGELRLLVCVHGPRNLPAMLTLVESAHPTKKAPVSLHSLHLVELTGRSTAMLIVNNTRHASSQSTSDHIVEALELFEQSSPAVSVHPLTAVSPYSTMHQDICTLAQDKRTALLLLPFHKDLTVDGRMEATNPAFQALNLNVLSAATCSVGIVVDRGLAARAGGRHHSHIGEARRVVVLFFGGADDREALCLGARMGGRPGAHLTIIRFLPAADGEDGSRAEGDPQSQMSPAAAGVKAAEEKRLDDELLGELRCQMLDSESAVYMERAVSSGEETVAAVRELGSSPELFIVGRSIGAASVLTSGLADWSDCPELGAVGDMLASSDFSSASSVLVVQQYVGAAEAVGAADAVGSGSGGDDEREQYLQNPDREVTPTATRRTSFSTYQRVLALLISHKHVGLGTA